MWHLHDTGTVDRCLSPLHIVCLRGQSWRARLIRSPTHSHQQHVAELKCLNRRLEVSLETINARSQGPAPPPLQAVTKGMHLNARRRDNGHKGRLEEFGLMTPKEGGEQQTEAAQTKWRSVGRGPRRDGACFCSFRFWVGGWILRMIPRLQAHSTIFIGIKREIPIKKCREHLFINH